MPSDDFITAQAAFDSRDFTTAAGILARLVAERDPDAQSLLGRMYLYGQGLERSIEVGIGLLIQAADGGSYEAAMILAQLYDADPIYDEWREYSGTHVEPQVAARYWQRLYLNVLNATETKDVVATKLLAGIFLDPGPGNAEFGPSGIPTDAQRAIELYEECFDAGDRDVAVNLRDIHLRLGNYEEAEKWNSVVAESSSDAGRPPSVDSDP